jgi:hypothetical protein
MVGQEAVGEFSDCIGVEEGGSYRPELRGREDAAVDQRLLHDADRQPAHVDEPVTDGDCEHHADAVASVEAVDDLRVRDPRSLGPGRECTEDGVQDTSPVSGSTPAQDHVTPLRRRDAPSA